MLTSTGMMLPCILDRHHFKLWSTLKGLVSKTNTKFDCRHFKNLTRKCVLIVQIFGGVYCIDAARYDHTSSLNRAKRKAWGAVRKCSLAEALIDNEMSHWSQNVVAEQRGGRQLNQITGLSASTDKQPQAWLNWGKIERWRRHGGNGAQSGDDSL